MSGFPKIKTKKDWLAFAACLGVSIGLFILKEYQENTNTITGAHPQENVVTLTNNLSN